MKKKYFSVILPIYINDKYIIFKKSFNSILNQTLKPNEIVVLLDGPIEKKIKNFLYQKKKLYSFIKIYNFKKNQGLGYILNYGVRKCRYDYIARCDADDFSRKDRFKKQMEYLIKYPEVDVLGSNVYEIYNNKIFSKKKMKLNHKDIAKQILFRNPMNHSSVFFKKKKLIQSGNYQKMSYFEDYYMWFRMRKTSLFKNLPDYLVSMKVDDDFFKRRSGIIYYKFFYKFIKRLYDEKKINFFLLVLCLLFRSPIVLLSSHSIRFFYKNILRI